MGPRVHERRSVATAAMVLVAFSALLATWPRPADAFRPGAAGPASYDRTVKVDLVDRLPEPPQLVIFGGSRAQRFEPSVVERLTGLSAFNFAAQNSRPEDAYAMTRFLFWRAPGVRLRCIWAVQATTLSDSPLHPGLLAERRLSQFLPGDLVAAQQEVAVVSEGRKMKSTDEYTARGELSHSSYDLRLERGVSFERTLSGYLEKMVARAGAPAPYTQTRAKEYFERTLQLFNLHDVEPLLVIMPYQPTALAAFRAVGWGAKEKAFTAYLESLRGRYRFRVVDYSELASFGGDANAFYDGSHITTVNARRILAQAVEDAPGAFR